VLDILRTWDFPDDLHHTCEHRDMEGHQDYQCWGCRGPIVHPGPYDSPSTTWAVRLYMCHHLQHLSCMLTMTSQEPGNLAHECPQCGQPHYKDTITQRIGWNEGRATEIRRPCAVMNPTRGHIQIGVEMVLESTIREVEEEGNSIYMD
jgi:hypothetical protein